MKQFIISLFLLICLSAFGQTKAEKKEADKKAYENLKNQLNNSDFQFIANWANTQKGRRISVYENPNFLNYSSEKIEAYLPYFGVANIIGYNSSNGISFDEKYSEVSKEINDKKQRIILKFSTRSGSESFNCTMTLYNNNTATLNIFSNQRDNISYDGKITFKELE